MRNLIKTSIGILWLLASTQPGYAAQRTFVASFGLDTNPCSVAAPCRSFAAAMVLTSPNGEILVLDSAAYGGVTVDKSVAIIAPEGIYAGITGFGGDSITVNGAGIKVVLRGLHLNGLGANFGIRVQNAATVHVENCRIAGYMLAGLRIDATGTEVFVLDSDISANVGTGVTSVGNSTVIVDRSALDRNSIGFQFFQTSGKLIIRGSSLSRNGSAGVQLVADTGQTIETELTRNLIWATVANGVEAIGTGGTLTVALTENVITDNASAGVSSTGSASAVLDRNVISGNGQGLLLAVSNNIRSSGKNVVDGNTSPDSPVALGAATVK